VLRSASGDQLLITVDQLVEGRHFAPGTAIDRIARKIIARSVSDIAAMGGSPSWALATAALPDDYEPADRRFDAMARWATHFGCPLGGGDIASLGAAAGGVTIDGRPASRPPLMLTCTVAGTPHPGRGPVLRSGAAAGDQVWVTGRLGGSLESGRHLGFEPRVREGLWLAEHLGPRLHAMIDLSDGLGRDAGRVAEALEVRIVLEGARRPLQPNVHSWEAALGDGEDYELCFVAAADAEIPAECPTSGTMFTCVGRAEALVGGTGEGSAGGAGPGGWCLLEDEEGRMRDVSKLGWDHGRQE